jgi:ubiquitin-conjugating enzyme E2 variant
MARPKAIIALEAVAFTAFAVLVLTLLYRLIGSLETAWDAALCLLAVPLGWLAADFTSGLVHWFADSFFEEDTPLIGPVFIQSFREHHRDPQAMARHTFLELTGNSALVLLPVAGGAAAAPLSVFLQATALTLLLALFATNLFHKWAHDSSIPAPVRWLQRHWLILPPAHHKRHHTLGHGSAYCVTTGWMNSIAECSGAFAALGHILVWLRVPVTRKTA